MEMPAAPASFSAFAPVRRVFGAPRHPLPVVPSIALAALVVMMAGCTATVPRTAAPRIAPPRELWIDLVNGEQASDAEVLDDLAAADVIFVGESHTIARHHDLQFSLLRALQARGVPLALCLEQLEAADQPVVDRYNRRELDFESLAREINWQSKWTNYTDYRALCEFAREHGIPVHGLNAPAGVIRAVSRGGGLAQLPAAQRARLPAEVSVDNPAYERLMNIQLPVHAAADPARLRPMFEAQMARDETMAANILVARGAGAATRTAFVVLGAGHIRFGLGTPSALRRRAPHTVDRLVLATGSDELRLTEREKAASREITISHADLRSLGQPPGDYLRVLPVAPGGLPAGHPPVPEPAAK